MNDFLYFIILLVINVLDIYIISRYMSLFFDSLKVKKSYAIIAYGARFVISILVMLYNNYPIINMLTTIGGLLIVIICYSSKISRILISITTICMCSLLAETITAGIVGLCGFDLSGNVTEFVQIEAVVISEIFLWLFSMFFLRFKNLKNNSVISIRFSMVIIIVIIVTISQGTILFGQKKVNEYQVFWMIIGMLITNISIIYLYEYLSNMVNEKVKNKILNIEKKAYHKQFEIIENNNEKLKKFKHDEKNRLILIQQLAQKKECEAIVDYTNNIIESIGNVEMFCNSGNLAIDSLINYKLSKAKKIGADIEVNVSTPNNLEYDVDDITIVIGNLLDNALEAINYSSNEKIINFSIDYERQILTIRLKNSFDGRLLKKKGSLQTRKVDKNSHGLGLQSVNDIVKKYNGIMEWYEENNMFIMSIMLYVE